MPVDKKKYLEIVSGKSEEQVNNYIKSTGSYRWADENTRFFFMSDCILIPGISGVASIGDIFSLSLPIVILAQYNRKKYRLHNN